MPKTFLKSVRRRVDLGAEGSDRPEETKQKTIGNKKRYDLSAHDDWSIVSDLSFVTRWELGKIPKGTLHTDGNKIGKGLKHLPRIKSSVWRRENAQVLGSFTPPITKETRQGSQHIFCDHCSKSFHSNWSYEDHMLVHLNRNSKQYACPKCSRTFTDRSNMLSHQRTMAHHDWKWICELCAKPFSEPKYLKRHCNRFHPQRPVDPV